MIDPRVASGLRDLPPSLAIPRERLTTVFRGVFARAGFVPIETPHIERLEVLTGKGAGSEEVLRQIFDVTNKGGKPGELALRFDLTVPLARFIAKHVDTVGVPFKRYAIGSVFRGERPAKGRFREFTQCDVDIVGVDGPLADAEAVLAIHDALKAAGIPPFRIKLNHRAILDGLLETLGASERLPAVLRSLDKLDKIGRDKVIEELTGVRRRPEGQGESDAAAPCSPPEETECEPVLTPEQAARVLNFAEKGRGGLEVLDLAKIDPEAAAHPKAIAGVERLRQVVELAQAGGADPERIGVDLGLARGLDYYTGIILETVVLGWERFGSVASGGRYDNLAGLFTSRRLPGVGASIGLDRLLALLEEAGTLETRGTIAPVLVTWFPGVPGAVPLGLAARLRAVGVGAEVYPEPIAVGKQMGYGSQRGHRLGLIVGPDEVAARVFNLRDLARRDELKAIPWDRLESTIQHRLNLSEGAPA